MLVLVVEDSAVVRARLTAMIGEAAGARVREACDGAAALAALEEEAVDAVVLDLHLPDGSGFHVLEYVKRKDPAIAVVVLTNNASEQHRRECLARGADHFFDKSRHFAQAVEAALALAAQRAPADTGGRTRLS